MFGSWLIAVVLSTAGAIAIRLAARALGLPARFVIGLGPRVRRHANADGAMELRWIPTWVSTELRAHTPRGRAVAASAAGPVAVVALPFVATVALIVASGAPVVRDAETPMVVDVAPGSAAERAGFESGDQLVEVEGSRTRTIEAVAAIVSERPGQDTRVTLERAGMPLELVVVPADVGGVGRIGVTERRVYREVQLLEATSMVLHVVASQYGALAALIMEPRVDGLSGPVAMTRLSGARTTRRDFIAFFAVLGAAWTAVSPLLALFVAVGQLRRHLRKPSPAQSATDEMTSPPLDPT